MKFSPIAQRIFKKVKDPEIIHALAKAYLRTAHGHVEDLAGDLAEDDINEFDSKRINDSLSEVNKFLNLAKELGIWCETFNDKNIKKSKKKA